MSLLEIALREGNYELAALTIVYAMLKVIHDGKEADRCPQGQPECPYCPRDGLPWPPGWIATPFGLAMTREKGRNTVLHFVGCGHTHQMQGFGQHYAGGLHQPQARFGNGFIIRDDTALFVKGMEHGGQVLRIKRQVVGFT